MCAVFKEKKVKLREAENRMVAARVWECREKAEASKRVETFSGKMNSGKA